ncbi:response regulator [Catenovulum adriaticum]|uniref:Response regulator n=1 Tax=Catenovulum adriaticum TaxID=2984846 RepID=A0ABY7APM5_9ALTE|nr:response regulator [Catenovulum sp. TS8]WAJ71518.1 response regulator [Catenovulum sp. TS8]
MDKADLSDFPSLKVLIIDESTLVHNMLTTSLNDLGISYIRCAENAYYALRLAEQTQFHIVICAFNVNSDKDGFHLLEELKFKGHVNKRTVLIFLSADTQASLVNSIVELQPDDFWVKPLAHKQVQARLNHTLSIKKTLYNVYQAIDQKEYSKVIYCVERHLLNPDLKKFHLPLMRLKGEAYLSLLEFTEAQVFFKALLAQHQLS